MYLLDKEADFSEFFWLLLHRLFADLDVGHVLDDEVGARFVELRRRVGALNVPPTCNKIEHAPAIKLFFLFFLG